MKILEISSSPTIFQPDRMKANKNCHPCPCCGSENIKQYLDETTYTKGFFKWKKYYRMDCYSCRDCGAKWQSDLFEVETK